MTERDFDKSLIKDSRFINFEKFDALLVNGILEVTFDIDGVVLDTSTGAIEIFNEKFGTNYTTENLTGYWTMVDLIEPFVGKENAKQETMNIWNSEENLLNASPMPAAWVILKHLDDIGIKPLFITSRPGFTKGMTITSFEKNFPWIKKKQLIIQNSGTSVGTDFKTNMISEFGPSIHFEDSIEHTSNIVSRTDTIVVIVNRPWNKGARIKSPQITYPSRYWKVPELFCSYAAIVNRITNAIN